MQQFYRTIIIAISLLTTMYSSAQQTIIHYLSGRDKDHTVDWDFFCTKGRKSGQWTKIPVPSQWEQQGFGGYTYGHDRTKTDEQGIYKYSFNALEAWKGKTVFIVFEGVMTDTEVKVNGRVAGDVHQGGFYQFKYDITSLLQFNQPNVLEVTVSKQSANASVNRAERNGDFWALAGIYRPVYLKVVPSAFIDRVAIDAKANGNFGVQVFSKNTKRNQLVEVQVQELNGKAVGKPVTVSAADSNSLKNVFTAIKTWNQEQPNLYNAVVSIKEGTKTIHSIKQRFGFRTAELRPKDGFYVNDVKVIFKGVNRHSAWPETGRTLSREIHLMDISLMKDMNMNAVRMSHYPPDQEFLDLCDSLGLFVIDELTGWQASYDTVVGRKLVKELVVRDVNHPSIVMWANGNEGGWNRALDGDYDWYDPQKRFVMHPWERFNGSDSKHYPDFNYVVNSVLYPSDVFFPTEFMHGLYDGGHGAALEDFWDEMLKHPYLAGGFLWSFHDEGIVRTDKKDSIDTDGNHGPDGIVGPHREKEGSYYTIKEIWSPVTILTKTLPTNFNGKIEVENRYLYSNLSGVKFQWKLVSFPKATDMNTASKVLAKGNASSLSLAPKERGWLNLQLPSHTNADALYLTAYDNKGKEIYTWSWPMHSPEEVTRKVTLPSSAATITVKEDAATLTLTEGNLVYYFDKATGYLQKVNNGKKDISLSGGPALAGATLTLSEFKHYQQGNTHIIEPVYKGDYQFAPKWLFQPGQLPRLEYTYSMRGSHDFMGITFNYPEENINGMKWLGHGPFRVWKNRLKGQTLGVWQKAYNNTITGESWAYPEFKGWHSQLYWVKLENKEADFIVYAEQNNIFLQMLQPVKPVSSPNENTYPPFPKGNIGFMHAISPIGTKFQQAVVMGPQSQKSGNIPTTGSLRFDFR